MSRQWTRRDLIIGASAAAGAAVLGGIALDNVLDQRQLAAIPLPAVSDRPERQHAWDDAQARDAQGNVVLANYHRLLMLNLASPPSLVAVRRLEAALRTLERRFEWGADGLLFLLGWGPRYFEHWVEMASPVERPTRLSGFETPDFDDYDVCLHLACDDDTRLQQVEAALVGGGSLAGAEGPLDLRQVFRHEETRTGFVGTGIPAAHQHNVSGIPQGSPVPEDSPLFMGFKSGFRKNQATEDDVTIPDGPLAGGTTMHVSRLRLRLDSWYNLFTPEERVARMFSPQMCCPAHVDQITDEAETFSDDITAAASDSGVVGHLQAVGRVRRNDRPLIIRRDFNTVDDGHAGLHFVALQRTIADFVATRTAMNAAEMPFENPSITPRVNNGIKEFIFVLRRGNYFVPPRSQRAFPLLPAREEALV